MFYQEGERAVLIDVSPVTAAVSAKSVKRWDDGSAIGDQKRETILLRAIGYFARRGMPQAHLVNTK